MMTLGLDTSEPLGGVALYEEGGPAEELWMDEPLRHAECLFPLIDRILDRCKIGGPEIDSVSVNRGPGSFTGLRIGLAAAKGLCQAWRIPLVGVDGTIVYRRRVPEAQRVCVVLASRRDLYYARWFGGSRPKGPTAVLPEAELIARLRDEERVVTLVGSGAPRVHEKMKGAEHVSVAADEMNRPSPLWVARVGQDEEPAGRLHEIEPLYVEPLRL